MVDVNYLIKLIKAIAVTSCLVMLVVLSIHAYVSNVIIVQQDSMNPTLQDGDLLITNKLDYVFGEPAVGDIVIVLKEEPEGIAVTKFGRTLVDYYYNLTGSSGRVRYVKRVVAVSGDWVEFIDGSLYVNGDIVVEDYVQGDSYSMFDNYFAVVPHGEVYLLGDNREVSLDSRHFGTVSLDLVESKVITKVGE